MSDLSKPARHLHHHIIDGLINTCQCPTNKALEGLTDVDEKGLKAAFDELENAHSIVLHPDGITLWIIHPFSCSPTATWVEFGQKGWFSPCLWCALGIIALIGEGAVIHERLGGEKTPITIAFKNGEPSVDLVVHFAVPMTKAWDNVHHHCAMVLPFESEAAVDAWCTKYGHNKGEVVPIKQAYAMAKRWYGNHAEKEFHKWTPEEAQEIFIASGLVNPFWHLNTSEMDRF